jgi:hypothetical protein
MWLLSWMAGAALLDHELGVLEMLSQARWTSMILTLLKDSKEH